MLKCKSPAAYENHPMKTLRRICAVPVIGVIVLILGLTAKAGDFERALLTVAGADIVVELAITREERSRGLMFRRSLPPDHGMLFDFQGTQRVAMWMKNTFIPLDMVFITRDGVIDHIAKRTVPQSLEVIAPPRTTRFVLEVNGGTADRLGWQAGDPVSGLPR